MRSSIRPFIPLSHIRGFYTFLDKLSRGLISNLVDVHSLWYSSGLINFWSCSTEFPPFPGPWSVEQFPLICRQNTNEIELKFDGPTYYGPPLARLSFGYAPMTPALVANYSDLTPNGGDFHPLMPCFTSNLDLTFDSICCLFASVGSIRVAGPVSCSISFSLVSGQRTSTRAHILLGFRSTWLSEYKNCPGLRACPAFRPACLGSGPWVSARFPPHLSPATHINTKPSPPTNLRPCYSL